MEEPVDLHERRRQRLALIELQVDLLQRQIALYREEELVERMPPQPEGRAALRLVEKAG